MGDVTVEKFESRVDEELTQFKKELKAGAIKGPFHRAKNTRADILPFGINGLYEYLQKGSIDLNPGIVRVNIGKPIGYEDYKTLSVEKLRDKLYSRITDLRNGYKIN